MAMEYEWLYMGEGEKKLPAGLFKSFLHHF